LSNVSLSFTIQNVACFFEYFLNKNPNASADKEQLIEGQKTYQDHPIHQDFVKKYSHLWQKVVVYDAIDV
jgi:hypothetical protein